VPPVTRPPIHERLLLMLALGILLSVGLGIIAADLDVDGFDPDEYSAGVKVSCNFWGYMSWMDWARPLIKLQFAPLFLAGYSPLEKTDRYAAFRQGLLWARVPAAVSGVLVIALVLVALRRLWPERIWMALFAGVCLVFNERLIHYNRWGMMMYSEYLLLTTALYFLLLTLLRGKVSRRQHVAIVLLSLITPWVYFCTLIPFLGGVAAVLLFRVSALPEKKLRPALREAWQLRYFGIAPLMFALASLTELFSTSARRASLDLLYFPSSGYAQNLSGVLGFACARTFSLFGLLAGIRTSLGEGVDRFIKAGILLLVLIGIVASVTVRRRDLKRVFTAVYVGLLTTAILGLSILNQYPYGWPRYAWYLLVPVLVLAAYGFGDMIDLMAGKPWRALAAWFLSDGAGTRVILVGRTLALCVLLIALSVVGTIRLRTLHKERTEAGANAERIAAVIREDRSDVVLVGGWNHLIKVIAPCLLKVTEEMGTPAQLARSASRPSDSLLAKVRDPHHAPRSVLVVCGSPAGRLRSDYPEYAGLFPADLWGSALEVSCGALYVVRLERRHEVRE